MDIPQETEERQYTTYLSIDNPQPSFECYLDVVWYAYGMLVWEVKRMIVQNKRNIVNWKKMKVLNISKMELKAG